MVIVVLNPSTRYLYDYLLATVIYCRDNHYA